MTVDEKKKRGFVATVFEDISRPLGCIGLIGLSYLQAFHAVVVHEIAWYGAGFLLAGEHALELAERVADKIIKAMNIGKK